MEDLWIALMENLGNRSMETNRMVMEDLRIDSDGGSR